MINRELRRDEEEFRISLFLKWTSGLSPLEQRISIFSHIRDIPYAIIPEWQTTDDIIRRMITENKGWCGPKHQLLSWMMQRLEIKTEPVLIPFRWNDQQVTYPEYLIRILPFVPDTSHLCCRAFLDSGWKILDATWDLPLRSAGFPVNNSWDGRSETLQAVTGIAPSDRNRIRSAGLDARNARITFVHLLNEWMEEIRRKAQSLQGSSGSQV